MRVDGIGPPAGDGWRRSAAAHFFEHVAVAAHDLDAQGLLSLAETLSGIGVANLATAEATLVAETTTDEAGNATETGYQVIDRAQLGVALGLLVPAA